MYLDKVKKKDISETLLVDTWLKKYHNTTLKEEEKNYKKENGVFLPGETARFYKDFAVSQKQHDEWDKQIRKELKNKLKLSKKIFDKSYSFLYLNIAPSIKN
mgnify:CR=1 FL=1